MVHRHLQSDEAGEHDVFPRHRIGIEREIAPEIFDRPIAPDAMIGLLIDQTPLRRVQVAAKGGFRLEGLAPEVVEDRAPAGGQRRGRDKD